MACEGWPPLVAPWGFVGGPWGAADRRSWAFSVGERRPAFFNGKSWPGATPGKRHFSLEASLFPGGITFTWKHHYTQRNEKA